LTNNGDERARITSTGDTGFGTSNPQSRIDVGGGYMANEQGRTDHVANTMPSPHYHFDGSTGNVNLGSTAHLSNFTGGHTISAWINLSSIPTDTNVGAVIFQNYSGKGSFFSVNQFAKLHTRNHGAGSSVFSGIQALEVDRWYHVARTNDGAVTKLFINGVLDSQSNDIGEWIATNNASVGSWSGGSFKLDGDISKLNVYNIGLSEDEVKELYSGASVPFKYKGASQTSMWDSGADVFTSGTYSWTAYSSNTVTNASNQLVITYVDNTGGAYVYFKDTNDLASNLTVGKRYRFSCDAKRTGGTSSMLLRVHHITGNAYSNSNLTTSMIRHNIEFIAGSADTCWVRVEGMSSGGTATIDNISLTQIGAVAEYDGSSATTSTWHDKSGNGLDGTVTGATLENKVQALEIAGDIHLGQGGQITFGDYVATDPIGLTEGAWNTQGVDSDNMYLYCRSAFRIYGRPTGTPKQYANYNASGRTYYGNEFGIWTETMVTPNGGSQTVQFLQDRLGTWIVVAKIKQISDFTGNMTSVSGIDASTNQDSGTQWSSDFGDYHTSAVRVVGSSNWGDWRENRSVDWIYGVPNNRSYKYFFTSGNESGMVRAGDDWSNSPRWGFGCAGAYDGFGRWHNPYYTHMRMSDGDPTISQTFFTTSGETMNWHTANDAKLSVHATAASSGQDCYNHQTIGYDDSVYAFYNQYPALSYHHNGTDMTETPVWICIKVADFYGEN